MKKIMSRSLWVLMLSSMYLICAQDASDIIIRSAEKDDLPALLDFDHAVSYEYFKPLFVEAYAHLPIGKDPDYFLDKDLETDKTWFAQCLAGQTDDYFLVAQDVENNRIAGFLIVRLVAPDTLQLELFMVGKDYRRHGVGRALFYASLKPFRGISTCIVYPFSAPANEPTLAFYRSLGFENRGPANLDKINTYGIAYRDMYYHFALDLPTHGTSKRYYPIKGSFSAGENIVSLRGGMN